MLLKRSIYTRLICVLPEHLLLAVRQPIPPSAVLGYRYDDLHWETIGFDSGSVAQTYPIG